MNRSTPGMHRYFYEFLFHQSVEEANQQMQARGTRPMMVSAAKNLRQQVDQRLRDTSNKTVESANDGKLGVTEYLTAVDDVMEASVEGYERLYSEGIKSPLYQGVKNDFFTMTGLNEGQTISEDARRLPVSPYDPRWSTRGTIKDAGAELRYFDTENINKVLKNQPDEGLNYMSEPKTRKLKIHRLDENDLLEKEGSPAYSLEDASGLTELRSRMSQNDYRVVREHVVNGAKMPNGDLDFSRYMSEDAINRSAAILDSLRNEGVAYSVRKDREEGQIKAHLTGTKMEVRLTDTRANERMVGRIYEDGVVTYYSTNAQKANSDGNEPYTPTSDEVVQLLRVAQGKPVLRPDGQGYIGEPGAFKRGNKTEQLSYHTDKGVAGFGVKPFIREGETEARSGEMVMIRRNGSSRSATVEYFAPNEAGVAKAEGYLEAAVQTARVSLAESLDVERLIAEYEANEVAAGEGEHFPQFSGDEDIAAIQRSYWDVLRGAEDTLLKPGIDEAEFDLKVEAISEVSTSAQDEQTAYARLMTEVAYVGSREQNVRDHAADSLDDMVGTYAERTVYTAEGDTEVRRFNPVQVANRMSSAYGFIRNSADVVAAMKASGVDPAHLQGSSFQTEMMKDRMVSFNPEKAQFLEEIEDPFIRQMGEVVRDSVQRNGGEVELIAVDDQGVVSYAGHKVNTSGARKPFTGEVGQIFSRGDHGEVITEFAASENYMFVPGYEARIEAQKPGENLSAEERTKLRGYEQIMADRIRFQVTSDMVSPRTELGSTTSINGVYRRLRDVRHDVDFIERAAEQGLDSEYIDAILATEAARVRYPNEVRDESTMHADWRARNGSAQDMTNDNHHDAFVLTGGRNMAVMDKSADGIFDPVMTGSGTNQGVIRYLVEGAEVAEDGSIVPSSDPKDRASLMKTPMAEFMKFDPYDRQQMSAQNLLNASAVTTPVGTAMMTFGGWTADDPVVVSQEFAEGYKVRSKSSGEMRALMAGDKLSDMHGNKGVISLVVDRNHDADFYENVLGDKSMAEAVRVFQENKDLDVVMSPFSAVSRFNGGTAREMMQDASELTVPSRGETVPGGIGKMSLIVTHKDVESGTKVYDDEALAAGRGRKASSQLAWALGSQGCEKIMGEFYGPNSSAAVNYREMLITMGMDMGPDGTLSLGSDETAEGAARELFEMPEIVLTKTGQPHTSEMRRKFAAQIQDRGGNMELPFPLTFPTGAQTPETAEGEGSTGTYKLPVLSSHLRSGQDMEDGITVAHDYSNQYLKIFESGVAYRAAQQELAEGDPNAKRRAKLEETIRDAPRKAQSDFQYITEDLRSKKFDSKRNVYRESLMASKLPNSATAVWTSDPRLDIDQVAMGPAMAESLGLANDDHAMIWRDPVLRDAGVRYMRVKVDERLTSVAINPVMDASFDGDFDGDSVAVVALQSEAAKREAMQKLSIPSNLLDKGQRDAEGFYPLAMQDSLDTKMSQAENPELKVHFEELKVAANNVAVDLEEGAIDEAAAFDENQELVAGLSEYYRAALENQFGGSTLRFDSVEAHMASVKEYVDAGAKGSDKKFANYAAYIGADPQSYTDLGDTQHTRHDEMESMIATAVKSHGTGIAGAFSQRGVMALRNEELKSVLELTYPVTQSVLQAKHDAAEARQKYDAMMGPTRDLWKGQLLDRSSSGWQAVKDKDGVEVVPTPEEWADAFERFYTDEAGLNVSVNREHIDAVAKALTNPETGRMLNIDDPEQLAAVGKQGSLMDRLAYAKEDGFEQLLEAAKNNENIFDGKQNGHFAPGAVRKNQMLAQEQIDQLAEIGVDPEQWKVEDHRIQVLANPDVLPANHERAKARGEGRRSERAATVTRPAARPTMPKPRFAEPEMADADYEMGL